MELPFTEAQMVSVHLDDKVKLFLEPGDQLHLDADLLDLPQSLRFSGQAAANNFLAGIIVWDFEHGRFDQGEQRLAEFLGDNPYPEYTEVVEEVMRETAQLKPGQPAPDFTLDDLQGQSVSLSDFKGQAVFLDFWASWCGPCIGAVPHLEELKQRTRDQKVVFLNISLDSADEWHQAVDEHGLTGVHIHAPGGWRAAVAQLYQVRSIPSYFLVGPDGRMDGRVNHVSDVYVEEVVSRIEEVVSGKVPSSKSGQSGIIIKG